jgi:hypothetical protein
MGKKYNKPDECITDKDTIVKYARKYMDENSLIDLYWFIHNDMHYPELPDSFARDVAYQMVGTGDFEMAYTDFQRNFLIIKRKWFFRHPLVYGFALLLISAGVSITVGLLSKPATIQVESPLEKFQSSLSDSLKTLQKQIGDSVAAIRSDTTFLRK